MGEFDRPICMSCGNESDRSWKSICRKCDTDPKLFTRADMEKAFEAGREMEECEADTTGHRTEVYSYKSFSDYEREMK